MDNLREELIKHTQKGLPGAEAHLEMAPLNRVVQRDYSKIKSTAKLSAVLVLLFKHNQQWSTMLMERNSYNGHHSGQISFPGGRVEPEDNGLQQTALREFKEEMGIELTESDIISELSELYIPPSNFYVQPYLAITTQELKFNPEEKEVKELVPMPLSVLLDDTIVANEKVKVSGSGMYINAPLYKLDEYRIWGATAMILSELKFLIKRINL